MVRFSTIVLLVGVVLLVVPLPPPIGILLGALVLLVGLALRLLFDV